MERSTHFVAGKIHELSMAMASIAFSRFTRPDITPTEPINGETNAMFTIPKIKKTNGWYKPSKMGWFINFMIVHADARIGLKNALHLQYRNLLKLVLKNR